MQTFNQSLADLYFKRQITLQAAINRSSMPDELQDMIQRGPQALNPGVSQGGAQGARR
jgi:Tfp pilus assembly ATPase PilU